MRLRFQFASLLFVCATVASAADPQLLKLVMPDAKVVSGIDVNRIKGTPFGHFFLSQLPIDSHFNEFIAVSGFDPRRDIHEVVMASQGDPQKKTGLLAVRGNFDVTRILALLKAEGKTPETYQGVAILRNGAQAAAFLDPSTVVAGDLESVRGAIDRRTLASGISAELSNKISRTSANQDAWVVSIVPASAFAPVIPGRNVKNALQGDLIKSIEQSSGAVRFGNMIEISGELTARTNQDASSLADVVKFLMGMAQMNAPAGQAAQFLGLLQNLTVNTEANAVKLSLAIPETDLETLIRLGAKAPRI